MLKIYTDGSCLGNPGPGGWAAIIVYEGNYPEEEFFGGEENTTNNRMELTAAIRGLEQTYEGTEIEIFTDSTYLKNAFTNGWLAKWKRTKWNKGRVLNKDLWVRLDELVSERKVNFNWVKAHDGNYFNERCDELARETAEKFLRGELKDPKKLPKGQLSLFDF